MDVPNFSPSKNASTNPCPQIRPWHRGQVGGRGQGKSFPSSEIFLAETSTQSNNRLVLSAGVFPALFPAEGSGYTLRLSLYLPSPEKPLFLTIN
jgi:hypothetical protein